MLVVLHHWNVNRAEWERCDSRTVEGDVIDLRAIAADYLITTRTTDNSGATTTLGPESPIRVELQRLHETLAAIETYVPCLACQDGGVNPDHAAALTSWDGSVLHRLDPRQALTNAEIGAVLDRLDAEKRAEVRREMAGSEERHAEWMAATGLSEG